MNDRQHIDEPAFKAETLPQSSFVTKQEQVLSEVECDLVVKAALNQYMEQAYDWLRHTPGESSAQPQWPDPAVEIAATVLPKIQLQILAANLVQITERNPSAAKFVVTTHTQTQRGEVISEEQRQQIGALFGSLEL